MQALVGFLRDVGWGVVVGAVVLLVGGCLVYFQHWGETKKERAKRLAKEAERADLRK